MGIQDNVPLGRDKRAIISLVINFIALTILVGGYFFPSPNDNIFFHTLPVALVFGLIAFAAGFSLKDLYEKRALEQIALIVSYLVIGLMLLPILYLVIMVILYLLRPGS